MSKMKKIYQIVQQVEEYVNTCATITDLKSILDKYNVTYLSQAEWEVLVSYLERYYIISNISYPYDIVEEIKDEVTN